MYPKSIKLCPGRAARGVSCIPHHSCPAFRAESISPWHSHSFLLSFPHRVLVAVRLSPSELPSSHKSWRIEAIEALPGLLEMLCSDGQAQGKTGKSLKSCSRAGLGAAGCQLSRSSCFKDFDQVPPFPCLPPQNSFPSPPSPLLPLGLRNQT